jgi:Tfp pilus assembly protein PilP
MASYASTATSTPAAPQSKPSVEAPATAAAVTTGAVHAPADAYSYSPMGRRDPFVSLLARGSDSKATPAHRGEGLTSVAVAEVALRGLLKSGGGYVAIVQGPDNKTYIARANDRLQDGTIRAINADGLVILQEVTDPLSLAKQKEVRKGLRATEEGK